MIKFLFLFTTLSIYSVFCFSSITERVSGGVKLTGLTTDKQTGEPLAGVAIYIPEFKTGAVSNHDGVYIINYLPRTKVLYQVSYIGYSTIIGTIDLSRDSVLDFALEIGAKEMTEIVVTGASRISEIKSSPLPIATMTGKELTKT